MNVFNELEKKHNLKPVKMAALLGISKSYYSMMRNGLRPISKNVAIGLRNNFGVTLDDSLCPSVHDKATTHLTNMRHTG
jgi:plasmid maintenance system antidote protein VapI